MDTNLKSISLVQRLHEVLFSLNIGFAIAFSLLAFIDKPIGPTYSGFVFSPATRLLLRSTIKLNQLLRLDPLRRTGREIIFITLILLIAILAFLLLRLISRTVLLTTLLYPLGGLAALALVPALWLYALLDNYRFPSDDTLWSFQWSALAIEVPLVCAVFILGAKRRISIWHVALVLILIPVLHYVWWLGIEIPLICAFFFLSRKWRIPAWCGLLILGFHYAWWLGLMWNDIHRSSLWEPAVFFVVFPGAGFAWLFYARELQRTSEAAQLAGT